MLKPCNTCPLWVPVGKDNKWGECHLPPRFADEKAKESKVIWPLTLGTSLGCIEHPDVELETVTEVKSRKRKK